MSARRRRRRGAPFAQTFERELKASTAKLMNLYDCAMSDCIGVCVCVSAYVCLYNIRKCVLVLYVLNIRKLCEF